MLFARHLEFNERRTFIFDGRIHQLFSTQFHQCGEWSPLHRPLNINDKGFIACLYRMGWCQRVHQTGKVIIAHGNAKAFGRFLLGQISQVLSLCAVFLR